MVLLDMAVSRVARAFKPHMSDLFDQMDHDKDTAERRAWQEKVRYYRNKIVGPYITRDTPIRLSDVHKYHDVRSEHDANWRNQVQTGAINRDLPPPLNLAGEFRQAARTQTHSRE